MLARFLTAISFFSVAAVLGGCVQSQDTAVRASGQGETNKSADARDTLLTGRADSIKVGIDSVIVVAADSVVLVRTDSIDGPVARESAIIGTDTSRVARDDSALTSKLDTVGIVRTDTSVIVMRFAGDCLLGGHYERAAWSNVHLAFEELDLFHTADISLVNLENPVTTRGQIVPKTYSFRMQPRFLEALNGAGIGVVTIANNHVYDYGDEGLFDTFLYLDSAGIRYVGAGRNAAEAHRPYTFTRDSQSVSILGYYGGSEAPAATNSRGGVARRDIQLIKRDVGAIREADSASYVVVVLHWGDEKAEVPSQGQREFARALIEAGVDAVIGHHPHVLQGIERYRSGVIAYSLGNLVFGGNSRHTYDTGVFEIVLRQGKPSFRFIPIGVREWRVRLLEGKDAERVTARVRSLSNVFPSSIFTD